MKLHFVVGPFGEGQRDFSRLLKKKLTKEGHQCRSGSCGSLVCLDNYGGVVALDLNFCLSEIEQNIKKHKNIDHLILNGVGLALYLKEILDLHFDANVYLVRKDFNKLENDQKFIETLMLLTEDITEEWIYTANKKINDVIEYFEKNTDQQWNDVNEIDKTLRVLKYEPR